MIPIDPPPFLGLRPGFWAGTRPAAARSGLYFFQKRKIICLMVELRAEFVCLRTLILTAAYSGHDQRAERDEVSRRILRMAELLRKMREVAQRN